MIRHTQWMAVLAVMVFAVGFVAAQDMQMIASHLGNEAPAFQEGITPSKMGWGPDDQAYPDRFVVYPQDGSEMVWVPAGEFTMGSEDDDASANEKPAHRVRITQGFWLQKHTVTKAQYRAFSEATGHEFPARNYQGDDYPVRWVSWDDAVAYAEHYGMSLPTEAQWEYAARGPDSLKYPWGNEWDPEKLCCVENTGPRRLTFPVGSFPEGASWVGALDMAGNVYEWCADWYDGDPYSRYASGDLTPPASGKSRVLRGGMYHSNADHCRSAKRHRGGPAGRGLSNGFRLVNTSPMPGPTVRWETGVTAPGSPDSTPARRHW